MQLAPAKCRAPWANRPAGQIDLVIGALRHHIAIIGSLDIRALPAERRLCSPLEAWSRTCPNLWFLRHFSASPAYDRQLCPPSMRAQVKTCPVLAASHIRVQPAAIAGAPAPARRSCGTRDRRLRTQRFPRAARCRPPSGGRPDRTKLDELVGSARLSRSRR